MNKSPVSVKTFPPSLNVPIIVKAFVRVLFASKETPAAVVTNTGLPIVGGNSMALVVWAVVELYSSVAPAEYINGEPVRVAVSVMTRAALTAAPLATVLTPVPPNVRFL